MYFFSRGALSCPPNDSKPSFPFQLQDIQLVITSCRRDVSSCYHLKVTARTSDCEGKAEKHRQGPNGLSPGPESVLATVAEPTVFGDMAEQGYSSW